MKTNPHSQSSSSSGKPSRWPGLIASFAIAVTTTAAAPAPEEDIAGIYDLTAVDGVEVPTTVSHGVVEVQVRSGTFTIKADGTCASKISFGQVGNPAAEREVTATYTREGARLVMKWRGAGMTTGTVEGDVFKMTNEGMVFTYRKQQSTPGGREVLDRLLGAWHTEYALSVPAEESVPMRGSADFTSKRILGGRFIHEQTVHADGRTHLALFTHDADRGGYRAWWFHSTGETAESLGKWDAETQTLTWTSAPTVEESPEIVARWKFESDTVFVWTVKGTRPDRTVAFRMEGKAVRCSEGKHPEAQRGS